MRKSKLTERQEVNMLQALLQNRKLSIERVVMYTGLVTAKILLLTVTHKT